VGKKRQGPHGVRHLASRRSKKAQPLRQRALVPVTTVDPDDTWDLTPREAIFVQEYLSNGYWAAPAMIAAGYSPNAAKVEGHRMLKHPRIHEAIRKAVQERLDKYDVSINRIHQELATMAFSDIGDYMSWDVNGSTALVDSDHVPPMKRRAIESVKRTDTENGSTFEFKLRDKTRPLELLLKAAQLAAGVPTGEGATVTLPDGTTVQASEGGGVFIYQTERIELPDNGRGLAAAKPVNGGPPGHHQHSDDPSAV
jgi:phage terminase small subunit